VELESRTFPVGNVHFAIKVELGGVPSVPIETKTVSVGANRNVGWLIRLSAPTPFPIMTMDTLSFPGSTGLEVSALVAAPPVSVRALSLIAPVSIPFERD
jgi:hypothetical protein